MVHDPGGVPATPPTRNAGTAVGFETRPWTPLVHRDLVSRRVWEQIDRPYQAAVPATIADLRLDLPDDLVEDVTNAQQQLVRFDTEVGSITAPFASILLRSESASSSQIENLTSGARAIAEAELGERADGNAPLIVSNVRAMEAALEAADDLSATTIIGMHRELLHRTDPTITGTYRTQQVWIGGGSFSPHDADFTPPHHERVAEAMADFEAYSGRVSPLPLASIAIAHAQFETIHPFPDGNGRTGRALVQAALRRTGLTRSVTVPISAGILQQRSRYFDALDAYRDGDVDPIVRVFADGAVLAVANGRRLVDDIEATRADWAERMAGLRSDAAAHEIAALAIGHPVLTSTLVRAEIERSGPAVFRGLDQLVERGILTETTAQNRNRLWVAQDVIRNLDGFANRSMRTR
ncbi:Fic family protein [Agromyces sp. MMS24-K17]|uniref:Fic family protein n=1 Tax=Agromyces sp. MMS24-K17 TaxID=3372850 RepID=UPI003754FFBD